MRPNSNASVIAPHTHTHTHPPRRAVHYYDSIAASAGELSRQLIGHLLHWLSDESAAKGGEAARLITADWDVIFHPASSVPQQVGGLDCGERRE